MDRGRGKAQRRAANTRRRRFNTKRRKNSDIKWTRSDHMHGRKEGAAAIPQRRRTPWRGSGVHA